ncbi:MAG: baseplate J/gp47 family protein [Tessaracoccus sp.]|uniref:baseplate J/gp47 family protein n=1 Tax=Tessaracoccus sp. TaxID=1971211 RepID=UPI001EC40F40|nr:baseplate J/gp47 family protein [Tessaracoccus sp.]MBK7823342.1 baseplate J/gp47 family protein [Tessaracoccus sp.]
MADPTYEELKTAMTREEVLEQQLAIMALPDFNLPTESWGPTDEPMATLAADANVLADLSVKVAGIAKSGVTADARTDVLTIHAKDVFDEARELGVNTIGTVTLTESAGSPQSWAVGDLIVTSRVDPTIIFRNTALVTLSASSSTTASIACDDVGTQGNVQAADLQLVTEVPGVALSAASGTGWITQTGTDDETDEKLIARCALKWATLVSTGPSDAYKKWALDADATINRVGVTEDVAADQTAGDPSVTVYLATATGAPAAAVVTAVDAYIQERRPLGTLVYVAACGTTSFYLNGSVTVKASKRAAAESKINALLDAWFAGSSIDVNGETVDGLGLDGRIRIAQLVEIVMSVSGVTAFVPKKLDGTSIYRIETDDVTSSANNVWTLVRALTYVEVT